jgi:regulatory protein
MDSTRTITALTAQKRNPERINVFLDGEFAFGLARIVAAWLHVGMDLSEERIAQLTQQDAVEDAYRKVIKLLGYRPRSEAEISRKLTEKDFTVEQIHAVLERLRKAGLVGDEQFARAWVDNRQSFRPRSRRMVSSELRHKGVTEEAIEQAISQLPDEETLAYQTAQRYANRLKSLDWETFRKKLSGHLGRKGFGYETVSSVVKRVWKESREEAREN